MLNSVVLFWSNACRLLFRSTIWKRIRSKITIAPTQKIHASPLWFATSLIFASHARMRHDSHLDDKFQFLVSPGATPQQKKYFSGTGLPALVVKNHHCLLRGVNRIKKYFFIFQKKIFLKIFRKKILK